MPALGWLRTYEWRFLRLDLVAGLTLAASLIPAGIADASFAQIPPRASLYACLFSSLVFWFLCSSWQTAITVTSTISLLIGATLEEAGGRDPARVWALAACTALMVSVLTLLVWAMKGGGARTLLLFPGLLKNPPQPVLAALGSGLLRGVLIGTVFSLFMLLRRASPHDRARMRARDGRLRRPRARPRERTHAGRVRVPEQGALLYFNVDHVRDRFFELLAEFGPARRAVFFLGAISTVDLAGAELLIELQASLVARGIEFRRAATPSGVRESLVRASCERHRGPVIANEPLTAAFAEPLASAGR